MSLLSKYFQKCTSCSNKFCLGLFKSIVDRIFCVIVANELSSSSINSIKFCTIRIAKMQTSIDFITQDCITLFTSTKSHFSGQLLCCKKISPLLIANFNYRLRHQYMINFQLIQNFPLYQIRTFWVDLQSDLHHS